MLGTGTTRNTTEQPEHATLEGKGDPPPQSNLPESPQLQSHLPSLQQLEQDGSDSDSMLQSTVNVLLNSMNQTFLKWEHPVLLQLVFQMNRMLATLSIFLKKN